MTSSNYLVPQFPCLPRTQPSSYLTMVLPGCEKGPDSQTPWFSLLILQMWATPVSSQVSVSFQCFSPPLIERRRWRLGTQTDLEPQSSLHCSSEAMPSYYSVESLKKGLQTQLPGRMRATAVHTYHVPIITPVQRETETLRPWDADNQDRTLYPTLLLYSGLGTRTQAGSQSEELGCKGLLGK